jgi:polyhydroxyalkanoate synthesis regulator phasin
MRLKEIEGKEKHEMESRLMNERIAYEETKDRLEELRKQIKKLKRKNKRAARTEK